MGVLQWGRDWTQFQIQHEQMGTYSQGTGWESGCGKSLRENIRGEWGVLPKPSYQDSCWRLDRCSGIMVMRNLIRCQGWSHSGVGRVCSTDLAGFFLLIKLDDVEMNTDIQESGLVGKVFRGVWVESGQWERLCPRLACCLVVNFLFIALPVNLY